MYVYFQIWSVFLLNVLNENINYVKDTITQTKVGNDFMVYHEFFPMNDWVHCSW